MAKRKGMKVKKFVLKPSERPNSKFLQEESVTLGERYIKGFNEPYNPANLWKKAQSYRIYDRVREDDQVHAILNTKKMLMFGSGWSIDGPDEETDLQEMATWTFNEFLDGGLEGFLFEMLTAFDYGFSLTEKIPAVVGSGRWQGMISFRHLKTRPPHGILFETDPQGNIEEIKQDRKNLTKDKYIHYVHNQEFGNKYGRSDINEGVYRAWFAKNEIIKYLLLYLERFGQPIAHGKYPANYTDDDRKRLLKALKNLQASTSIVTPEKTQIEIINAASSGNFDGFDKAIDKFNLMIARGLLVPDLIGLGGGQTSGGSFALGEKQFELFFLSLGKERLQIKRAVNAELLRLLAEWNFGSFEEIKTRFKLNPLTEENILEMAKTWTTAIGSAKWIPTKEEINHFRSIVNFPTGEVVVPPPTLVAPGQVPPPPPVNPPTIEEDAAAKLTSQSGSHIRVFREKTTFERRVNFQQIKRVNEDAEMELVEDMAELIRPAVNQMTEEIIETNVITKKKWDVAIDPPLPKKLETDLRIVIRKSLGSTLNFGKATAESELSGIEKFAIVDDIGGLGTAEAKAHLDATAAFVAATEVEFIKSLTTPIILEGIKEGHGIREIMKQLDDRLRTYDLEFGAARLNTIARNNSQKIFNEGRAQFFKKAEDEIAAFQYSAILDGRTSEICLALDGRIFSKQFVDRYKPPNHHNCRSLLIAILTGEAFKMDRMPNMTLQQGGFLRFERSSPESEGGR